MKRVAIAMSGGVDSSVVAHLMKSSGYDCIGTMMNLIYGKVDKNNCKAQDINDAIVVANTVGIPFHLLDFNKEFYNNVICPFVVSYLKGETPNPCVQCNKTIKFSALLDAARNMECDYIATGHYARVEYCDVLGRYLVRRGIDINKDQSYVLYNLTQDQLAHILLPLGVYSKPMIRKIAEDNGLVTAHKSDSQDICFIKGEKYTDFIHRNIPILPGNFVDMDGNVLGQHRGIINYTIGQRKGLGISCGVPMFVVGINADDNTVILGTEDNLYCNTLIAKNINLISCDKIDGEMKVTAKIRYRHKEQPATVTQLDSNTLKVVFDEPQRAITPGQSVVLYDDDILVGGGIIQ